MKLDAASSRTRLFRVTRYAYAPLSGNQDVLFVDVLVLVCENEQRTNSEQPILNA